MLVPISFNAKHLAKIPVASGSANVPLSAESTAVGKTGDKAFSNANPTIASAAKGTAGFQWVSFGADQKTPSEGVLATQELEEAKDLLRAAMKKAGMKLDDANFLILSSGKKLYGIVPKNYSNQNIKDFEKALIEALKELPAETYPRLTNFAKQSPAAVLIERVQYYRPA